MGFDKDSSYDIHEKLTLFVSNIPYSGNNNSLTNYFSGFGKIKYAICMMNRDTNTCKGNGFVQFMKKSDTDRVLGLGAKGELDFEGRSLLVKEAVDRKTAKGFDAEQEAKKSEGKDKRGIYLSKEGLIRPETAAAQGVSEHDMNLREKLLEVLRKKLKNDNMFMSETRLVIHNIPKALSDKKLKDLVYEHVRAAAKSTGNIQQARLGKIKVIVMRNREGNNKSLGFAFVDTDTHAAALLILRTLNNNPEVFLNEKRPIVEFCCENKKALDVQEARRQKRVEREKAGDKFGENKFKNKSGQEKNDGNPETKYKNESVEDRAARKAEYTKNSKSNVEMENGKLFKHQGMPAQRRRKGEKLTVPRLKKKARHRGGNAAGGEGVAHQAVVESAPRDQKKGKLDLNKFPKTKELVQAKLLKTQNRKAGKMAKERKEENDFSALVNKYSATLK